MTMIEARSLSVSLGKRQVIRGVDLTLARREVVGLIGPNGTGKSTLIRTLAGQLPGTGTLMLENESQWTISSDALARKIAYLPQTRTIGWPILVADLVALGRLPWRGRSTREADAQACRRAMALFDVEHLAERRATELSGGEQAGVLAARAVAQDTPVLLADEPTSGLDPAHAIGTMQALRKLAGDGSAVLVSLHDLTLAARWCDRVIVLHQGAVAANGEPETVFTPELLAGVFGISVRMLREPDGLIVAPTGLAG